jgi:uncharacterized protein with HEPN domain
MNPNITWDIITENPDKLLNEFISLNPNVTWDIVETNPDCPWNYYYLSKNPNITWDIVEANPDCPWNYTKLSKNRMKKHPFFQNKQLSYVLK